MYRKTDFETYPHFFKVPIGFGEEGHKEKQKELNLLSPRKESTVMS